MTRLSPVSARECLNALQRKVSVGVQQHIDDLLEKNGEGALSAEERLELEKILAVSQVMTLAKTKARLKLVGKA